MISPEDLWLDSILSYYYKGEVQKIVTPCGMEFVSPYKIIIRVKYRPHSGLDFNNVESLDFGSGKVYLKRSFLDRNKSIGLVS